MPHGGIAGGQHPNFKGKIARISAKLIFPPKTLRRSPRTGKNRGNNLGPTRWIVLRARQLAQLVGIVPSTGGSASIIWARLPAWPERRSRDAATWSPRVAPNGTRPVNDPPNFRGPRRLISDLGFSEAVISAYSLLSCRIPRHSPYFLGPSLYVVGNKCPIQQSLRRPTHDRRS